MTRRKPEIICEFHLRLDSVQVELISTRLFPAPTTYVLRVNEYEFEDEWKEYRLGHDEIVVLATLFGKVI